MAKNEKLVIAAPIRDRAWILPDYLKHLVRAAKASSLDIAYLFLENDSVDETLHMLNKFTELQPARFWKYDFGYKHYRVKERERGLPGVNPSNDKKELAQLRNMIVEEFLKTDAGYLLFWDSDVMLPEKALSDDRDSLVGIMNDVLPRICTEAPIGILAADVQHPHCKGRFHNYMNETRPGQYNHVDKHPFNPIFQVDTVGGGGAALYRREIFEAGGRFGPHPQGEDIALCRSAQAHGYEVVATTTIKGLHIAKDQYQGEIDISEHPYGIWIEDWLNESNRSKQFKAGTRGVDSADT